MAPVSAISAAPLIAKTTFEKCVDGVCGPLLVLAAVASASSFEDSRKKYVEIALLNPASDMRVQAARKKMVYEGIGAVGVVASLIGWTFVAGLLPQAGLASLFFNAVGFGASGVVAVKGASDAFKNFSNKYVTTHERRLALFALATRVVAVAWAVLGALALFTGIVTFATVGVLLIATFGAIFLESFYKEAYDRATPSVV